MNTSKIKDGGPAFPTQPEPFLDGPQGRQPASAWGIEGNPGMSLRAWLAGLAMQGFAANASLPEVLESKCHDDEVSSRSVAKCSIRWADALISELEKEP